MTHRVRLTIGTIALTGLLVSAAAAAKSVTIRRFAVIAGVNRGGDDRVRLRYAATDAKAFAHVMSELGGVAEADRWLLLDTTRSEIETALEQLDRALRAAQAPHQRLEALLYYSGHSDENGLLIDGERIEYQQLRRAMDRLPADVRLAVVDSCASGALTREKGGRRLPPFLADASNQVKGRAFLTSSSSTEAAQESDRIAGSFFTHFLISGLRGAADTTGDGRVTLTEAYQFAFHETLASTEKTRSGPQHPNYDINLAGSGDLVMTDLRHTSATLVLSQPIAGRLYIRDRDGRLVVELNKLADRPVELGLAPGPFTIILEHHGRLSQATVGLRNQQTAELSLASFHPIDPEDTTARGPALQAAEDGAPVTTPPSAPGADPVRYRVEAFSFTALPTISAGGQERTLKHLSLNLLAGYADRIVGGELGAALNVTGEALVGAQLAGAANILSGSLAGAQLAGAINIARQPGKDTKSGEDTAGDDTGHGAQLSGAVNYWHADHIRGAQLSGALNVALARFDGWQVGGALNLAGPNAVRGVQLAGAGNWVLGCLNGVQAAGALNVVANSLHGLQLSGAGNFAGDLAGVQVGVLNVASDVTGLQLGVLNLAIGRVAGTQIGVLNLANSYEYGVPVGLVGLTRQASYHPEVWSTLTTPFNVGLRVDVTDRAFTLLTVGYQPGRDDEHVSMLGRGRAQGRIGFGLGGWILNVDPFSLRLDAIFASIYNGTRRGRVRIGDPPDLEVSVRALVSTELLAHLGLYGGVSFDSYFTWSNEPSASTFARGLPVAELVEGPDFSMAVWPSLCAGIQF